MSTQPVENVILPVGQENIAHMSCEHWVSQLVCLRLLLCHRVFKRMCSADVLLEMSFWNVSVRIFLWQCVWLCLVNLIVGACFGNFVSRFFRGFALTIVDVFGCVSPLFVASGRSTFYVSKDLMEIACLTMKFMDFLL